MRNIFSQSHGPLVNVGIEVGGPPSETIEENAGASMQTEPKFAGSERLRVDSEAIQSPEGSTRVPGGTATVEQASFSRAGILAMTIAVKKFFMIGQRDRRRVSAFANELRITAGLNHPNIVKLIGFVEEGQAGIAWLLFRWETNGNIRDFLLLH
ncbi:hypothetical protein M407DRAFT_27541 [Tulasnella calospora MUT 4182]|uniref:Protein kinase domain-containing protein n=1 Tax=Tulasnella calospora MUT 4182 TaxID=1051891 RepID=A0A0C3QCB0_9AGAM|nr:hypothetical protein M407DRAFT_27541 [Tulasnella calospora MUT 4182]